MRIVLGYNWPTYRKKWGFRKFTPLKTYGVHFHFGKYALAVNPWGKRQTIISPMDEPWEPHWFHSGMFYKSTGEQVSR